MRFYEDKYQALLENNVTAVFAVSDFYALEFMRFLQGKDIQIPKDIQIIGFDDNMASRESNPSLTTIHQEASLRAKTAIKCLEAMRDGAECETEIVLPVELVKKRKYEGAIMSKFMKSLCKIAIPVTLQSMLQASFSIVDQIMIGQLGETNISAVGLCGNFSLIFSVVIGAVSTVAGILIAQFIGAEDTKEAWSSFDVSLICGMVIATHVFVCGRSFSIADSGAVHEGCEYCKCRCGLF